MSLRSTEPIRRPAGRWKPFRTQIANLVENRGREPVSQINRASPDSPVERTGFKVVISLRQDHLPKLLARRAQMPSIAQNHFVLEALSGRKAVQAVLGPGRRLLNPANPDTLAEKIVRLVRRDGPPLPVQPVVTGEAIEPLDNLRVEPALLSFSAGNSMRRERACAMQNLRPD